MYIDYQVEVERHPYSVPHALIGQVLEARLTTATVEVLRQGQRVANHVRSGRAGGFTTIAAHMPAAHRAHMEWTPLRLIRWGEGIGPGTAEAVTNRWCSIISLTSIVHAIALPPPAAAS